MPDKIVVLWSEGAWVGNPALAKKHARALATPPEGVEEDADSGHGTAFFVDAASEEEALSKLEDVIAHPRYSNVFYFGPESLSFLKLCDNPMKAIDKMVGERISFFDEVVLEETGVREAVLEEIAQEVSHEIETRAEEMKVEGSVAKCRVCRAPVFDDGGICSFHRKRLGEKVLSPKTELAFMSMISVSPQELVPFKDLVLSEAKEEGGSVVVRVNEQEHRFQVPDPQDVASIYNEMRTLSPERAFSWLKRRRQA